MAKSERIVIGKVRFSYLHVFEPYKHEGDDPNKPGQYSATLLIPKTDKVLVAKINAAIKKAYEVAVVEKWGGTRPKDGYWTSPLQDGDSPKMDGEPRGEECKGHWFLNAKCSATSQKPQVVDGDLQPIIDSEEFYSGCYGRASVTFAGYTFGGSKKGISCYLNNLQKLEDGEPLGGSRISAADEFSSVSGGLDADEEF